MIEYKYDLNERKIVRTKEEPVKREYKGKSRIMIPDNFTVIDIETTGLSPEWDEIIELSAIKVSNSKIIDTYTSLVKPNDEIDAFITELSGITNEMLQDAPSISQILPAYLDFIGDDIVLGHNVNFDINFIYDNVENILSKHFSNDFIDTMRFFRKLHPEQSHHTLQYLSSFYEINVEQSHRALDDCKTTLSGFLKMCDEVNEQYDSVNDFKKTFSKTGLKASDISTSKDSFDEESPIFGKVFCFTGVLERMPRKDAMQIVVDCGGINGDNVTKNTNYLVLGNNDYCSLIKDGKSNKQKKAEKLKLSGQDIEIIPEDVFYDMLPQ